MTDARLEIQSLIEIGVPYVDIRRGTRSLKQLVMPTENRTRPRKSGIVMGGHPTLTRGRKAGSCCASNRSPAARELLARYRPTTKMLVRLSREVRLPAAFHHLATDRAASMTSSLTRAHDSLSS